MLYKTCVNMLSQCELLITMSFAMLVIVTTISGDTMPDIIEWGDEEVFWDFSKNKDIGRVGWPENTTDDNASICSESARKVSIRLSSGVVYESPSIRVYAERKNSSELRSVIVDEPEMTLNSAVAEARRVMKLLQCPADTLEAWNQKAAQLDYGAVSNFSESFELGLDHCTLSILHSFANDLPWIVQLKIYPLIRDKPRPVQKRIKGDIQRMALKSTQGV